MKKLVVLFLFFFIPLSLLQAASVFSNPSSGLFGDTWTNGTNENISWAYSSAYGTTAKLLLFRNTGSGNVFVNTDLGTVTNTSASHSYSWKVNAPAGSGYKIAICPTSAVSPNYSGCGYSSNLTIRGATTETQTSAIVPTLTVSPTTISPGGSATLSWGCSSAGENSPGGNCYCLGSLIDGTGQLASTGSKTVAPTQTTTYTLSCRDKTITNSSYISKTAMLTVSSAPVVSGLKMVLKANGAESDLTINAGTAVNLSWAKVGTGGFTTCRLGSQPADTTWDGVGGNVSGSKPVAPTVTTNYSIICWDSAETNYTDNLKVTVENPVVDIPPPVIVPTTNDTDKDGVLDKDDKCPATKGSATKFGCLARTYGYVCDRTNPLEPSCRFKIGYGDSTQQFCAANCKAVTDPNAPTVPRENDSVQDQIDRQSCERPFSQILADINSGKTTKITEASFYGWANDDKQDNFTASGGKGSGDKQDVKNAMAGLQGVCQLQGNSFNNSLEVLNYMINNPNFPIPLSLTLLIGGEQSGHRVIALSANRVGNVYEVEVIDPTKNGSRKYKLTNCGPENPGEKSFYCDSPIDGKKAVFISSATNYDSFINSVKSYCRNSSNVNSKFCQGRSSNLSTWLSNSFPQLGNFIDIGNSRGNCAGWTDFILRVAYFGDFIGADYHPSDRIGVRCNSDLTPKQGAFNGLSSQLANLKQLSWPWDWFIWKNFFDR